MEKLLYFLNYSDQRKLFYLSINVIFCIYLTSKSLN